ncbi:MAG TPA: maleylacetoacetate isomerase [Rhodanobacteraceae bacterium]|nr:maleylacetoacetate isomerase [Rhodanobacteraceae bacterium]
MQDEIVLYSYWRSTAAYRVRIALNLKGLGYRTQPVHLLRDGGQQHAEGYVALNPQHLVPTVVDGQRVLTQSLAIMEYLDEHYVEQGAPLLPRGTRERARVRALALAVACDIHPLANLRVLQFLQSEFDCADEGKRGWIQHWIATGFDALEAMLASHPDTGAFCHDDDPGMADACLVPQVYNAQRWGLALDEWPTIARIHHNCMVLDAFLRAAPEQQPDAPEPATA